VKPYLLYRTLSAIPNHSCAARRRRAAFPKERESEYKKTQEADTKLTKGKNEIKIKKSLGRKKCSSHSL
jgi:hypothetical protein